MTPPRDPAPESRDLDMSPEALAELRRLARSRPRSGRGLAAQASALRTLERLARDRGRMTVPPVPPGWHPQPGTEWEELDRAFLDANPERRRRWWSTLWREGRV